jgi:hypothetical protein
MTSKTAAASAVDAAPAALRGHVVDDDHRLALGDVGMVGGARRDGKGGVAAS